MSFHLSQLLQSSAERSPEKQAVCCGRESLSYEELAHRSNGLAHALRGAGVKRGSRVAIAMEKSVELLISVYGILKAGAAYVPLDASAPAHRQAFLLNDCEIEHLVTSERRFKRVHHVLGETPVRWVMGVAQENAAELECLTWEQAGSASAPPDLCLTEQDLAYILYTSGTTGEPKGMMHTHRSSLSFVEWSQSVFGLRSDDRVSNHAPLHFDLSVFDFFTTAAAGASCVILPDAYLKMPASLAKLLEQERVSVFYGVPLALIELLHKGLLDERDLTSLRRVLFGGEAMPTKHLRSLMQQLPHTRFTQLYGVTETNVCTYYHLPGVPLADDPVPIGQLCQNMEALVVDQDDRSVKEGEIGELLVRGAATMVGYWGRPSLTQAGFYRRSVGQNLEDIFYRTGDLVEQRTDGNYLFRGRADRQVKIRGHRLELDEVEVALLALPQVVEAVAFSAADCNGSLKVVAVVKLALNCSLSNAQLKQALALVLPTYAIPSELHRVDEFPRTSTGKIARRELSQQIGVRDGRRTLPVH